MNQAIQAIAKKYNVTPCRAPGFAPSGFPALDAVTGGVPVGRIVDIHGAEDTGKTALAVALARGTTLFLDAENKLTPDHVRGREGFFSMHPSTLEDALEICRTAARGFDTVVIDSIEALPMRLDLERGVGEYSMSEDIKSRERLMSTALPILSRECLVCGCALIIVNQMRNRPEIIYGRPDAATGGKVLLYYAALRLETIRVEIVSRRREAIGQIVRVRVMKHKYKAPFGEAELVLDYRRGWQSSRGVG